MVKFTTNELLKEGLNNIHIIYHHKDTDGRCGGAVIRFYCEEILNKKPNMIPFNHYESTDFVNNIQDGDTVYIVDISLPFEEMRVLNSRANVIWFDHHKTSIAENEILNLKGETDSTRAGCGIAYDYLLKNSINPTIKKSVDKMIELFSDYDNWNVSKYGDEEYKNTPSAVSVYMSSISADPSKEDGYAVWKELFTKGTMNGDDLNEILKKGRYLQNFQDKKNAGTVKANAFEIEFEGLNAIVCFGVHGSQSFDAVYNPEKHDMMIAIIVNKNKKYDISLYSTKKNVDVSLIAKKYGGGGHAGASGMSSDSINFNGDKLIIN